MNRMLRSITSCLAILFVSCSSLAQADGKVRVFILAGQSNMAGAGQVVANPEHNEGRGSLEWLVHDPSTADRFQHLIDDNGEWVAREDVQVWFLDRMGNLAPGFGGSETTIGPELGFGWVVGDAIDDPVLLIKLAWGGKSLGVDFRPPSSGGDVGPYYTEIVTKSQEVMREADTLFPQYSNHEFVLSGIGWHQGWNDRVNQSLNDEYEQNLANFIRDIRRDLDAPDLPFVIAEKGMHGPEETHPRALSLMAAQAAVADYEEFEGTVAFVGTREFYRPPEVSPSGQGYHWNSNAETYYLIGAGMGEAMLRLLENDQ